MNEGTSCAVARLFSDGVVSVHALNSGYAGCQAYRWICEQGTIEAKYEMQSFLTENEETVRQYTSRIQAAWLLAHAQAALAAEDIRDVQDSQMSNSDDAATQQLGPQQLGPQAPESPKRPRTD